MRVLETSPEIQTLFFALLDTNMYKAHAQIIKPFKNKKNKLKTSTEQPGFGHSSSRVLLIPLALSQCSRTLNYLYTYGLILLLLKTLYYSLRKTKSLVCQ